MNIIKQAAELARSAHQGQKRRDGKDYFTHVEAVADILDEHWVRLNPESASYLYVQDIKDCAIAAAFLHDFVEDTAHTLQDLKKAGFPALTVEIVDAVTRRNGETYYDFIGRIIDAGSHSRLAGAVKMADLRHNISDNLEEGSVKDKYRFAFHILHQGCPYFGTP